MEIGNPKQVGALAVVAVGALIFLFTRLDSRTPAGLPVAMRQTESTAKKRTAPLTVLRDPFSHPRLAPVEPKLPEIARDESPKKPISLGGSLAEIDPLPSPRSIETPLSPLVQGEPVRQEPTEIKRPVAVSVSLEGVVGTSDAVAFLSVDGAESRPFHASDPIVRGVRLLRIGDGVVVLGGLKGRFTLDVGEKASL